MKNPAAGANERNENNMNTETRASLESCTLPPPPQRPGAGGAGQGRAAGHAAAGGGRLGNCAYAWRVRVHGTCACVCENMNKKRSLFLPCSYRCTNIELGASGSQAH